MIIGKDAAAERAARPSIYSDGNNSDSAAVSPPLNFDFLQQLDPSLRYACPKLFVGRIGTPLGFAAAVFRLFSEPLNFHCELTVVARIGSPLNERHAR